jgi:hypothetical protein
MLSAIDQTAFMFFCFFLEGWFGFSTDKDHLVFICGFSDKGVAL